MTNLKQYLGPGEKPGQLKGKVIENYWNSALQNSPLETFMNERDENALENLINIYSLNDNKDIDTITYKFVFKSNPYFH